MATRTRCSIRTCGRRVTGKMYRIHPGTQLWDAVLLHNPQGGPFGPDSPICSRCYRRYHKMIGRPLEGRQRAGGIAHPPHVVHDIVPAHAEQQGIVAAPGGIQPNAPAQEDVLSLPLSQRYCCVCGGGGRSRISAMIRAQVWHSVRTVVPLENRVCVRHLTGTGILNAAALQGVAARAVHTRIDVRDLARYLDICLRDSFREPAIPAEDIPRFTVLRSDSDCVCYTGLSRDDFQAFVAAINIPGMRPQTKVTALSLLLCTLRMGNTQDEVAHLFGLSQGIVSTYIDRASIAVDQQFVPEHLGYRHMTRERYIQDHMNTMTRILHELLPHAAAVLLDGTYFEVEASSNFVFQKTSFSMQKRYNLVKFMIVCAPDGHVLDVFGPTGSDAAHNDAAILRRMLADVDGFRTFFRADDVIIVDRGFRDSVEACEQLGIRVRMPPVLAGRQQFTREEADFSRMVTKVRWVVESVNGRIKNVFTFFRHRVPDLYLGKLGRFLRIVVALLNAYFRPIYPDRPEQLVIARYMVERSRVASDFLQHLQALGMDTLTAQWRRTTVDDIPDFPVLDEQDLRDITAGIYQIGNAPSYTAYHLAGTGNDIHDCGNYVIYRHGYFDGMLLVRMPSRFVRTKRHTTILSYMPGVRGPQGISHYHCSCQTGRRLVGMCSHTAAVLWLLSYALPDNAYAPPAAGIDDGLINLRV